MTVELKRKVLNCVNEKEVVNLAKDLTKIKSYSGEEGDAAKFLIDFMEKRGFEVEPDEVEKGRFQVIGRLKGAGEGSSLMFNGHIDTDMVCGYWTKDPWNPVIENGRLYGVGVTNMKAGVTAMVMAADAVRKLGIQLKGDLIVAAVVGELQGGVGTKHLLKRGLTADMAVIPEPTNLQLSTVQAGVRQMMIHVIGRSRHVTWHEEGINAIEKMAKVINTLKDMKFTYKPRKGFEGLPQMVLGVIHGGIGRTYEDFRASIIPDFCTLTIDIRYLPGMTPETIKKDIARELDRIKAEDPDFKYEIELGAKLKSVTEFVVMPPMDVPLDEYVVQTVKRNHEYVTKKEPKVGSIPHLRYAGTDGNHLWEAGIPCVIYGPGWSEINKADENVVVEDMINCTKVLALTALDVCTKTKEETG